MSINVTVSEPPTKRVAITSRIDVIRECRSTSTLQRVCARAGHEGVVANQVRAEFGSWRKEDSPEARLQNRNERDRGHVVWPIWRQQQLDAFGAPGVQQQVDQILEQSCTALSNTLLAHIEDAIWKGTASARSEVVQGTLMQRATIMLDMNARLQEQATAYEKRIVDLEGQLKLTHDVYRKEIDALVQELASIRVPPPTQTRATSEQANGSRA